ncbi:MAG: alpha/beta hydrolase [Bacteroidia bacterium]|nr:alpha/beta hydrolase [Bacteroidia bacterium]
MKFTRTLFAMMMVTVLSATAAFALNPSREYKQLPDKYNMIYEEEDVTTSDGATLKAWYFPSTGPKTTQLILMCHNGEGNMADYLRKVDQFRTNGYNVVIFDYRGYGKSSDFAIDNNMYLYPHFQDDVKAMIDFCRGKYVQAFNIYGWGMGAGLAMGIGWNRLEIKKIIADTPFLSMEDLEKRFSSWDTPMEVPFAGYDKKFEPIYSLDVPPTVLKNGYKQVLLIIGSNDILFKVDDMKALQKKQPKMVAKDIYVVTNPDRLDNFIVDKAAYFKVVSDFMAAQ